MMWWLKLLFVYFTSVRTDFVEELFGAGDFYPRVRILIFLKNNFQYVKFIFTFRKITEIANIRHLQHKISFHYSMLKKQPLFK